MSDHSSSGDGVPDPDRIATQQDIGRALTLLRNRAGLTVRQVARASGLPVSTVGDYFSGRHLPATGQAGSLHRILAACGETDPARLTQIRDNLEEVNPMLGHRGSRLGISYPEIYQAQARAILEAALELKREGVDARPEIMLPLNKRGLFVGAFLNEIGFVRAHLVAHLHVRPNVGHK